MDYEYEPMGAALNSTIAFLFRTALVDHEVVCFHSFFLKLFPELLCKQQVTPKKTFFLLLNAQTCSN